jgi:hypothetical protein
VAVIEIITFRITCDDETFLAADKRVQEDFFYQQPGMVRRTMARASDGTWLALTVWASETTAAVAAAHGHTDPSLVAIRRLVDPTSWQISQFETLD